MGKAIILGATGEVGGYILENLLQSAYYKKVYVLGRSSINKLAENNKMERQVISLEQPVVEDYILDGADVFFAIGTDNREDFEKVDYGYARAFADICEGKIRSFNLVSAMGANSKTSYKYLQVKGRLEDDLSDMNLGSVRFYRPSMLLSPNRKNLAWSEAAWIKIFQVISSILVGPMRGWKGIRPQDVALAMVRNAENENRKKIYLHKDMMESIK